MTAITPMQTLTFDLTSDYVELCNLLKLAGVADSGGRGKAMVAAGLVTVDGAQELRKTAKIRAGQTVECAGMCIAVTRNNAVAAVPNKPDDSL